MRQHIINGNRLNGNTSTVSSRAIVADRDGRTLCLHSRKRLVKHPVVPGVCVQSRASDGEASCQQLEHGRMPLGYPTAMWPAAAFEPPAAAWAALVISRAISV